jgi:hypothetical protein
MRDKGEPLSRGRVDRPSAESRALWNVLVAVGLFGGAVLVNGILAILGIEALQALGIWPTPKGSLAPSP